MDLVGFGRPAAAGPPRKRWRRRGELV